MMKPYDYFDLYHTIVMVLHEIMSDYALLADSPNSALYASSNDSLFIVICCQFQENCIFSQASLYMYFSQYFLLVYVSIDGVWFGEWIY
jgi:hypothetical protein